MQRICHAPFILPLWKPYEAGLLFPSHLKGEEIKAERLNKLPNTTQPERGEAGMYTQFWLMSEPRVSATARPQPNAIQVCLAEPQSLHPSFLAGHSV